MWEIIKFREITLKSGNQRFSQIGDPSRNVCFS